jgi:general secretion pathway protein K
MSTSLARQRGIALLVAIVLFALATTIAAAITYNKAMASRRAAATFALEQALQAGMSAEALASIVLQDNGSNARTTPDQDWAQTVGPLEIEGTGVWIQAQLEDLSARFNLNSLVHWDAPTNSFKEDEHQVNVFRALLRRLSLEPRWADLMVDWVDPDNIPYGDGGEDTLYVTQVPSYRPPNTFITHPSELLALPGFGPERYAKLAPYVTALPVDVDLNLCTANAIMLDVTKSNNQQEYDEELLKTSREKGCFPAKATYMTNFSDPQVQAQVDQHVDEKSSWFRLRTHIRIGTAEFVLYSVLFRESDNKVRVVQRSFGSE